MTFRFTTLLSSLVLPFVIADDSLLLPAPEVLTLDFVSSVDDLSLETTPELRPPVADLPTVLVPLLPFLTTVFPPLLEVLPTVPTVLVPLPPLPRVLSAYPLPPSLFLSLELCVRYLKFDFPPPYHP